jgi:hypothetical protein
MEATLDQPSTWKRYSDDIMAMVDASNTEIFSIPTEVLDTIHLKALQRRFRELRSGVAALDRLATEQGVTEIRAIDDVVPLLFPHTFYKSYAIGHLEKGRYDRLNAWLQELTSCDLSKVDLTNCQSLEQWMDAVEAASPVQCLTTSGTSGKISFVPRTRQEWPRAVINFFVRFHQGFGDEPNNDLTLDDIREVPIFFPNFRHGRHTQHRIVDHLVALAYDGDESMVMPLYQDRMDLDVLLLAGRIAAADAMGRKVEVPPALLARRDSFLAQQAAMPEQAKIFFEEVIARHAGKRITTFCTWGSLYDGAMQALRAGKTHVFRADSLITTGGGMKGRQLPEDYYQVICDFLGMADVRDGYGCSEQHFAAAQCPHGHYHVHPLNIPFVLDPDSGEALPRKGTVTGRFAFMDLAAETYWGGFITGDEVTMTWDIPCACGRIGPYIHRGVQRYSEKQGGDDKINCAGVPQAHQRALDVIVGQ